MADKFEVIVDLQDLVLSKLMKSKGEWKKEFESFAKEIGAEPGSTLTSSATYLSPRGRMEWNKKKRDYEWKEWQSAKDKANAARAAKAEQLEDLEGKLKEATDRIVTFESGSAELDKLTKEEYESQLTTLVNRRKKIQERIEKLKSKKLPKFSDDPLSSTRIPLSYTVPETAEQREQAERDKDNLKLYLDRKKSLLITKQREAELRAKKHGIHFQGVSEEAILELEKLANTNISLLNEEIKYRKAMSASNVTDKRDTEADNRRAKKSLDKLKKRADLSHIAKEGKDFPFTGEATLENYERQFDEWKKQNAKDKAKKTFDDKQLRDEAEKKAKADKEFNAKMRDKYTIPALKAEIAGLASSLGREVPKLESEEPAQMVKEMLKQKSAFNKELNAKLKKEKEAQDRGKHLLMSSASIGIGLMGSSAMPLLNVAFASWSGGIKMAVPAAIATALGETVRGIDAFRESVSQASKSLDLISRDNKLVSARYEATKAVYGSFVQTTRSRADELKTEFIEQNPKFIGKFEAAWGGIWNGILKSFKNPSETTKKGSGIFGNNFFRGVMQNMVEEESLLLTRQLPELKSALKERQRIRQMPTVGIENDPYSVWMRVQQEAITGKGAMEEELLKTSIATIERQIKAMEDNTAAIREQRDSEKLKNKEWMNPDSDPQDQPGRWQMGFWRF